MKIKANGKIKEIKNGSSILDFIKTTDIKPETVIIAYNKLIVKKETLSQTILKDGDELEILRITAGG